jgi:hypothetical protein
MDKMMGVEAVDESSKGSFGEEFSYIAEQETALDLS